MLVQDEVRPKENSTFLWALVGVCLFCLSLPSVQITCSYPLTERTDKVGDYLNCVQVERVHAIANRGPNELFASGALSELQYVLFRFI